MLRGLLARRCLASRRGLRRESLARLLLNRRALGIGGPMLSYTRGLLNRRILRLAGYSQGCGRGMSRRRAIPGRKRTRRYDRSRLLMAMRGKLRAISRCFPRVLNLRSYRRQARIAPDGQFLRCRVSFHSTVTAVIADPTGPRVRHRIVIDIMNGGGVNVRHGPVVV